MIVVRYRQAAIDEWDNVGSPVPIESLIVPTKPRELSPRQRAIAERDDEIRRAVNEAAVAPESQAIPIKPRPDQKLTTLRAAISRIAKQTGSAVNVGVRNDTIYLSRGSLPGRGGRRRPM